MKFTDTASTLFMFILHLHLHLHFLSSHWAICQIWFCKIIRAYPCLVTSNKIFSLTSQKGDIIAGVDYLKVRNEVVHCKTIISDRNQIHAAQSFSLLSSWIRDGGKTSLRRRTDIFVSDRDPQWFFCINLWCAILLQVI